LIGSSRFGSSRLGGWAMTAGLPDGDGILDPDGARAYLQDWKGRIDRTAADTKAMSDRLGQLRVTGEDGNGLAEVTIDSTGALLDVRFHERIQRLAPDAVSRAVMSAMREARRRAAERSRRIIAETVGSDSVAGRTIAERMDERLRGTSD
jgi:DNA-binding protein YbaB